MNRCVFVMVLAAGIAASSVCSFSVMAKKTNAKNNTTTASLHENNTVVRGFVTARGAKNFVIIVQGKTQSVSVDKSTKFIKAGKGVVFTDVAIGDEVQVTCLIINKTNIAKSVVILEKKGMPPVTATKNQTKR